MDGSHIQRMEQTGKQELCQVGNQFLALNQGPEQNISGLH